MAWAVSNQVIFTAILLSGFSALLYQLIWLRMLGLVFGVSSFAVATVVAVFLLGLGFGSYFFGRWADRFVNPLKTYMMVEIFIAVFSLLSSLTIFYLPIYKGVYVFSYNHLGFYGMSIVRLLLSILILFPPVFLIGGTMPLVSKYFLTSKKTLGSSFSKLYYLNTLGAFLGAILTGFLLVRTLGVFQTFLVAICSNLLVAGLVYWKSFEEKMSTEKQELSTPYTYMLIVLFVTGFISLSYEILWVRILSTYSLSTSEAFALIVSGFLMGFSAGAYYISKKIDFNKNLEIYFCKICILTGISGSLVLYIFQKFQSVSSFVGESLSLNPFIVSLALSFLVSFIPAVCMGILFPLGMRIYTKDISQIGIKTGKIFFSNTLGCVTGSIVTGFLLIPFVGMWNTTLVLVNLSFLLAVYMFIRNRGFSKRTLATLSVTFLLLNSLAFSEQKTFHKQIKGFDVIYYSEGLSGTVSAIESNNYRGLFVDGQNVSGTDMALQADSKMLAHLPLLIADDPKRSLTVGYGTGATSFSMLLHCEEVDAVEIEEEVIKAGPLFKKVNFKSYEDDNLNIIIDDARNFIDTVTNHYDAIVTDVTNLKYKRNPYLYTKEYFKIMKNALTDDGVAAAWLPLGGVSFNDLKTLIGTFDSVYDHTTVWYFTQYPTHFIIVTGTTETPRLKLDELAEKMKKGAQDLQRIGVDNEYEIASMLLLGEKDVDRMVSDIKLHTDNFPVLEYSDMNQYMMIDLEENLENLLKLQEEDLSRYFVGDPMQIMELKRNMKIYNKHYRDLISIYKKKQYTQNSF